MRIVCFGDSLTWGQYGGSYVDALARLRPEHTFLNAGVGGDTVLNLLDRLERDVIAAAPDAALVMVGCNDAISQVYPGTRPYYQHSKKIPQGMVTLDQFGHAYRALLERLQLAYIHAWIGLEPAEYSVTLDQALRAANDRARMTAASLNLPVLDLYAELVPAALVERPPLDLKHIQLIGRRGREGWHDYDVEQVRGGYAFTFDGLHPTPAGAQKIAHLISAFIADSSISGII